jgi:hypothetical protein
MSALSLLLHQAVGLTQSPAWCPYSTTTCYYEEKMMLNLLMLALSLFGVVWLLSWTFVATHLDELEVDQDIRESALAFTVYTGAYAVRTAATRPGDFLVMARVLFK